MSEQTLANLGIKMLTGTYDRIKGVQVKAVVLKDAIIVKKTISKIEPKESD